MSNTKSLAKNIRSKKLGLIIRNARQVHKKSSEECAQAMGISTETYLSYENGIVSPSLPEIELLAFYYKVPLEHFLDQSALLSPDNGSESIDPQRLINLRQRMVGIKVRKIRLEAGIGIEEVVEKTGISPDQLSLYESGQKSIPLPELEVLAGALNVSLRDFHDVSGLVGGWFQQQRVTRSFQELSAEMQAFVSKPVNQPYLELAQRLSEMDVEKLRTVAEGLLEITL